MRLLLVHPGASWSTHDVFMGILDGLQTLRPVVKVSVYPLDLKLAVAGRFLAEQTKYEREQGRDVADATALEVQLQACDSLITRALVSRVDWVVVVTAMFVPPAILQVLRLAGLKVAVVLTESPYDEDQERIVAAHANVVFTNEKRTAERHGWIYLPHAWRKGVHEPSDLSRIVDASQRERCVFVGSGFPERVQWLTRFVAAGANLDLYGAWDDVEEGPLKRCVKSDVIANLEAVRKYLDYGCALNLYRTSRGWHGQTHITDADAWSLNPRAYELAALGVPHVSSRRAETSEKFGDLVLQTDDPEEAAVEAERLCRMGVVERMRLARHLRACVATDHWNVRVHTLVEGLEHAAP